MLLPLALATLLQSSPHSPSTSVEAPEAPSRSLSFISVTRPFLWDKILPLDVELDGLRVKTIVFSVRQLKGKLFKDTDFGTRAQVEVTNTGKTVKIPGFAVAVLDADRNLLGVATGGPTFGGVEPGETETFDLNFAQVKERVPKGAHYILSIELR